MEIARTDRVWPHGSRAERAHPTELCSTWKATKRAGPYFWRMRGGAPRVIINRTNFDSSTLPPRKIFPFPPRMRRMSVENIVYTWNRGTNFLFFFFIRFLLTVVSKPLKDSLHQRDIFFRYTYFYLNFKKIVDLISTERRIALLTFQVRHCSRCLAAFSPTPAFSPFSSGFHLSKWRRISDVPLEFEAIAMISIRKFRRYRTG